MRNILVFILIEFSLILSACNSNIAEEDNRNCETVIENRVTTLVNIIELESTERVDIYSKSSEDYMYSYDIYFYNFEVLHNFNGNLCNQLMIYGAKYDKETSELLYGETVVNVFDEGVYAILSSHANFDILGNRVGNSTENAFYVLLHNSIDGYDMTKNYEDQSLVILEQIQDIIDNYDNFVPEIID